MALVVGHSQTKYLAEYLPTDSFSVFAFPGYKTRQFLTEEVLFDIAQYFSNVVLVVGANDICYKSPKQIVADIGLLCEAIRYSSPSVTVHVSEVLPRGQNWFPGYQYSHSFLDQWNEDAHKVNILLREMVRDEYWMRLLKLHEFLANIGNEKRLQSRDGLHLSANGSRTLAHKIATSINRLTRTTITTKVPQKPIENIIETLNIIADSPVTQKSTNWKTSINKSIVFPHLFAYLVMMTL